MMLMKVSMITARIRFMMKKDPTTTTSEVYPIAKAGMSISIKLYRKVFQRSVVII